MKELKRDAKLLRKTAKRIRTIPKSYNQATFMSASDESPCGVVACLAGEIVIASEPTTVKGIAKLNKIMNGKRSIVAIVSQMVGLSLSEAAFLFFATATYWPDEFRDRYDKAKTERGRANAAADLLEYLADGGEVS